MTLVAIEATAAQSDEPCVASDPKEPVSLVIDESQEQNADQPENEHATSGQDKNETTDPNTTMSESKKKERASPSRPKTF